MKTKKDTSISGIELRVKIIRALANLGQVEFAKSIGIEENTYKAYEKQNSDRYFDNADLDRIAATYNINKEWLYKAEGNIKNSLYDKEYYVSIAYRVTTILDLLSSDKSNVAQSMFLDESTLKSLLIGNQGRLECICKKNDNKISWGNSCIQEAFINYLKIPSAYFFRGSYLESENIKTTTDKSELKRLNIKKANDSAEMEKMGRIWNVYNDSDKQLKHLDYPDGFLGIWKDKPDVNLHWICTGKGFPSTTQTEIKKSTERFLHKYKDKAGEHTILLYKNGDKIEIDYYLMMCNVLTLGENESIDEVEIEKKKNQKIREKIVNFLEWNEFSDAKTAKTIGAIKSLVEKKAYDNFYDKARSYNSKLTGLIQKGLISSEENVDALATNSDKEIEYLESILRKKIQGISQFNEPETLIVLKKCIADWGKSTLPVDLTLFLEIAKNTKINLHWLYKGIYSPWLGENDSMETLGYQE